MSKGRSVVLCSALLAACVGVSLHSTSAPAVAFQAPDPFAIPSTDEGLLGAGPIRRYEWGSGLGAAFPGVKLANRGISGDTTRGVLLRLQDDVLVLGPAAVVLLIG